MGAAQSDDREPGDTFTLQQRRAQFRMLQQQLQEARFAGAAGGEAAIRPLAVALAGGAQAFLPVPQPVLRSSRVFKNPAHLHAKTLSLSSTAPNCRGSNQPPPVHFCFDATLPGVIAAHWGAVTVPSTLHGWSVRSVHKSMYAHFEAGMNQAYTVDWTSAKDVPSGAPQEKEEERVEDREFPTQLCSWPLLIELRVLGPAAADDDGQASEAAVKKAEEYNLPASEWTMCNVIDCPGLPQSAAEVVGQQIVCSGAPVLDIVEAFGSELISDNNRQDCIVCQSEPRDTMVLPCRHMCLCSGCSEYIRTRIQHHSYKCPICRKRISRMMRVDPTPTPQGLTWASREAAADAGASADGASTPVASIGGGDP